MLLSISLTSHSFCILLRAFYRLIISHHHFNTFSSIFVLLSTTRHSLLFFYGHKSEALYPFPSVSVLCAVIPFTAYFSFNNRSLTWFIPLRCCLTPQLSHISPHCAPLGNALIAPSTPPLPAPRLILLFLRLHQVPHAN